MDSLDFLYKFLSKKTGEEEETIRKKVKEKIEQFNGLITEEGALALVAKEYNIDISPILLKKRFTISFLTPGIKNVEITVKLGRKLFEKEKAIGYLIFDETGTAKLIAWNKAKEELMKYKEGDVIRIFIESSRGSVNGLIEIHVNKHDSIIKETDKEILDIFKEMDPSKTILDLYGVPLEYENNNISLLTLNGRVIRMFVESFDPNLIGEIVHVRGIKDENEIRVKHIEGINYKNMINRILSRLEMMNDKRAEE